MIMMKGVQMKNLVSTAVLLASLALLAGCPAKKPDVPPPAPTPTTDTSGVDNAGATAGDTDASMGPSGELLSKRIVYSGNRFPTAVDSLSLPNSVKQYLLYADI